MTKERSDTPLLSEKLEKQIEAFFDGELDERRRAEIEQLIAGRDGTVLDTLSSLRETRVGVRNWSTAQYIGADGSRKKIDVWSKIAAQAEQIASDYRQAARPVPAGKPLNRRISALISRFNQPLPAFGLAAAAVVGTLAVIMPGPDQAPVLTGELSRDGRFVLSVPAGLSHPGSAAVSYVSDTPAAESTNVANTLDMSQLIGVEGDLNSARLSRMVVRLGERESGNGPIQGLEADGLNIVWIKPGDNTFKLLESKDRKAPPVIWVARRAQ